MGELLRNQRSSEEVAQAQWTGLMAVRLAAALALGAATFGLIGLSIGPVLLSVSFAMVADFARSAAPKSR